jgi:hypothetical protein
MLISIFYFFISNFNIQIHYIEMDSDDEIQQIDPPVIIRFGRFCRRSKRHNNNVENLKDQDCIDTMDISAESSHSLENPASR